MKGNLNTWEPADRSLGYMGVGRHQMASKLLKTSHVTSDRRQPPRKTSRGAY